MKNTAIALTMGLLGTLPLLVCAADRTVDQKDRSFSLTEVTLHIGDKIVFHNGDSVTHDVYSDTPGMEFEAHHQAPGGTSAVTFAKEGTVEVRCAIHPKMKLTVHVVK